MKNKHLKLMMLKLSTHIGKKISHIFKFIKYMHNACHHIHILVHNNNNTCHYIHV
jgi:hypothetical protein